MFSKNIYIPAEQQKVTLKARYTLATKLNSLKRSILLNSTKMTECQKAQTKSKGHLTFCCRKSPSLSTKLT